MATPRNGQTGVVRRRRVVPAALLFAVLLAVFAVAPSLLASSDSDTPAHRTLLEPAAAATSAATGDDLAGDPVAPVADSAGTPVQGVELLPAVQYVCDGMPVDPRVETTVVDCAD